METVTLKLSMVGTAPMVSAHLPNGMVETYTRVKLSVVSNKYRTQGYNVVISK